MIFFAFTSASSTAIARAAPPAPKIHIVFPSGLRTSEKAVRNPFPSVFSPINFPSRLTTQFTAPIMDADSPRPSNIGITETLCGAERLNPSQFIALAPITASCNPSGKTSVLIYRIFRLAALYAASTIATVGLPSAGVEKLPVSLLKKLGLDMN